MSRNLHIIPQFIAKDAKEIDEVDDSDNDDNDDSDGNDVMNMMMWEWEETTQIKSLTCHHCTGDPCITTRAGIAVLSIFERLAFCVHLAIGANTGVAATWR